MGQTAIWTHELTCPRVDRLRTVVQGFFRTSRQGTWTTDPTVAGDANSFFFIRGWGAKPHGKGGQVLVPAYRGILRPESQPMRLMISVRDVGEQVKINARHSVPIPPHSPNEATDEWKRRLSKYFWDEVSELARQLHKCYSFAAVPAIEAYQGKMVGAPERAIGLTNAMPCERCASQVRIKGSRYCKECKKVVLAELKEQGYLTREAFRKYREPDARENVRETKFGRDG